MRGASALFEPLFAKPRLKFGGVSHPPLAFVCRDLDDFNLAESEEDPLRDFDFGRLIVGDAHGELPWLFEVLLFSSALLAFPVFERVRRFLAVCERLFCAFDPLVFSVDDEDGLIDRRFVRVGAVLRVRFGLLLVDFGCFSPGKACHCQDYII